jgi:hypothetical protein
MNQRLSTFERRTPRWSIPVLAVLAGGVALGACGVHDTGRTTSEQTPIIRGYQDDAPYVAGDNSAVEPTSSATFPSDKVLRSIITHACEFTVQELEKDFPELWGDGLEKYSKQYDEAYHNKAEPWMFDEDLARHCTPYAQFTDHGAG